MIKLFRYLIGILIFGGILWFVDLPEVVKIFLNMDWWWIGALILLGVVMVYVSALKWRILLREGAKDVTTLRVFSLYMMGYFVNLIGPSYLGGDAARSYLLGKKTGQGRAASATVFERLSGLVAMCVISTFALPFAPSVPLPVQYIVYASIPSLILICVIILKLSDQQLEKLSWLPSKILSIISKGRDALKANITSSRIVFQISILSLVFHLCTVLNTWLCCMSVGADTISILSLFWAVPLILIIGALPISPGGLGVQEGAFVFFLSQIGISAEQALLVAIVLRAKFFVMAAIGGLLLLREGSSSGANS